VSGFICAVLCFCVCRWCCVAPAGVINVIVCLVLSVQRSSQAPSHVAGCTQQASWKAAMHTDAHTHMHTCMLLCTHIHAQRAQRVSVVGGSSYRSELRAACTQLHRLCTKCSDATGAQFGVRVSEENARRSCGNAGWSTLTLTSATAWPCTRYWRAIGPRMRRRKMRCTRQRC